MFLRNKPVYVKQLGKGVKNVFKKVENDIWKKWCLRLTVLSLYRKHLQSKSTGWFLCNGSAGLKRQREYVVKVNTNL